MITSVLLEEFFRRPDFPNNCGHCTFGFAGRDLSLAELGSGYGHWVQSGRD